ncbi:RhoGAP-domain-containing protein [Phellopilus nigrolimitatus]|nr:RhoGAP-domain-containing protein [Phellopilus nigrolimitatus]
MDPAIASRVTASPSSLSSRSHSTSSPTAGRVAHAGSVPFATSSSGIGSEDSAIMSSPSTVEQALAAHAAAPDPMRAALETALQERNSLSAQNSQLWNHLKKQRNNYQLAAADVKRIRAERDALRLRLAKFEHADGEQQDDRRLVRPSTSTAHMPANTSIDENRIAESTVSESNHSRHKSGRHHSEDNHVHPRRRTTSRSDQRAQTTTTASRSHERIRGQERERSNTQPESSAPNLTNGRETPTSPSSLNDQMSSHASRASNDTLPYEIRQTSSPPPLSIPVRTESLPSGSSTSTVDHSPSQQVVVNISPKTSEDPPETAKPSSVGLVIPSINTPIISREISQVVQTMETSPAPIEEPSSTASISSVSVTLAPNYLTTPSSRKASRESRISLPDEARRYYANLADSPISSPHIGGPPDPWGPRGINGEHALSKVPEELRSRGDESASPRPFLELDTTDESESEHRLSEDVRARETDSELDTEGVDDAAVNYGYKPKLGEAPARAGTDQLPKLRVANITATADQFPLPPATVSPSSKLPLSPTHPYGVNGSGTDGNTNMNASGSSLTASMSPVTSSGGTLAPDAGPAAKRPRDKRVDSFIMPTNLPAATFRQMPLLNTDLKTSTVEILGSHIRANDKGKEVLSFVIAIHVVGKESWQIEKFYSDVLALDGRLRSRCGRTLVKKIEPLPDNKLFKDHAPAKVDQRKKMLQAYLQSVMNLPIKDKNEIIVFFSSDVVRERSPVTKNGYKEGYLTKRGKNFGGWKTRYFVLQGPVLEYYENRGGAHLGSIQITGAQIGRQQKPGSSRDSDDENEFRHAFLIIEQKRGPVGQNTRHVLCAESDRERDSWVEVLVRYVMGSYNEDEKPPSMPINTATNVIQQNGVGQSRASTSSLSVNEISPHPNRRTVSKDLIQKSGATPVPISQLAQDSSNAKFFSSLESSSPIKSPAEKGSVSSLPFIDTSNKRSLDRVSGEDGPLSSSLPTTSNLSDATLTLAPIGQRSNSELGHYPDLLTTNGKIPVPAEQHRPRERARASYHPTLGTVMPSPTDRSPSPEKTSPAAASPLSHKDDGSKRGRISGPLGGTPIPAGYKFGGKDPAPENDRERKARSRAFWRWPTADKGANTPIQQPRAVFGVPLEESLDVSQIANLPAIVFRCIEYLEANKADQEEGIYRLSGSSAVIKSLKDRFNAEGDVDLLASDVRDPHAIAGLLKSFLRELPASLLTREAHMRFLAVIDFVDTQERIKELSELISQLPLANYSLLRALTAHLILIVQNSNVNKMTMRNVGIVFSPTLGIPAGVFSLMLGEFNRVFNVGGEGSDSSIDGEDAVAPAPKRLSGGLNRRNSKRYSDAAADQMLGLAGRTLPATAEDHSDDGDDISIHDQDESDTEATEPETEGQTIESSADSTRAVSPIQPYQEQLHPPPGGLEAVPSPQTRASFVAASRGLNISGLPVSPRPEHSPTKTPTSISHGVSPVHTPR